MNDERPFKDEKNHKIPCSTYLIRELEQSVLLHIDYKYDEILLHDRKIIQHIPCSTYLLTQKVLPGISAHAAAPEKSTSFGNTTTV